MTVCQLIDFLLREVAQKPKMNTARPKRETARLARVLSSLSSLAMEPTMMMAMVSATPAGIRIFSGIICPNLTPVLFQTQCIGFVTTVMGIQHVMMRIMMANQNKKGMTQFLSLRCRTTDATHHLRMSVSHGFNSLDVTRCVLPSEQSRKEDVHGPPKLPVE